MKSYSEKVLQKTELTKQPLIVMCFLPCVASQALRCGLDLISTHGTNSWWRDEAQVVSPERRIGVHCFPSSAKASLYPSRTAVKSMQICMCSLVKMLWQGHAIRFV